MTPPVPVPMPPAIHVPVIQQVPAQAAAPFSTSGSVQQINAYRPSGPGHMNAFTHFRWWHVKHWKGAKHRKPVSRGQGRKAKGKKARRRHA
jgi:hypothetical protein